MVKLVEHHSKSGCDGNSNTPVLVIKRALEDGDIGPNPGTRDLVLFLADHKPEPQAPKSEKRGLEAISRIIFYGYMDTAKFTKFVVPDALMAAIFPAQRNSASSPGGAPTRGVRS